jgi:thymidylate synthase
MDQGMQEKLLARYRELSAAGKIGVLVDSTRGNIPVLYSRGRCLPEAWENSLVNLWVNGCDIRTQYDEKDAAGAHLHPPSKDCSMTMIVEDPLSEPYIHRCFPGGLEDLEEYRQEVIDGIKDHWVRDPNDPADQRWEYTYHERLARYRVPGLKEAVNQFEVMAQNIAKSPITRRAQMISWKPWEDDKVADPPCWQSYWGRISRDEKGVAHLNLNMRFRSRDAYKAAFMNDFAFILLGKRLAERVSQLRGEEVRLGRFVDESDSFHIYGSYFAEFESTFIKQLVSRSFEERTWSSTDEMVAEAFADSKPVIAEKIRQEDAKYGGKKK